MTGSQMTDDKRRDTAHDIAYNEKQITRPIPHETLAEIAARAAAGTGPAMIAETIRRVVAEEIRKALDEYRHAASVVRAESALGKDLECQNKDVNMLPDRTSISSDGELSTLQQTALARLSRMRLKPKPLRNATRTTRRRAVGQ